MRVTLVLLLIGCMSALEFQEMYNTLDETQFGQTILQTIQMELASDDPVLANLINMMQGLEAQLESEQKRDDDRIARISQNCQIDLSQLNDILDQSTVNSITLKSQLDTLNPQKAQAVYSLERKVNEIKDLRGELDYQTKKRETENHQYTTILDHLEQALFGVNQVKGYFNKYLDVLVKNRRRFDKPEPSFLQEASFAYEEENEVDLEPVTTLAQVAQHVKKLKHHVKLQGYKSMLDIICSLAQQVAKNDEASESEVLSRKVLSILKQIEGYIQSERIREDQAEQARVSAFTALQELLADQIVQAQEDKTYMEGLVTSLSTQIQSATNEKQEVDQKVVAKTREREDRDVDCRLKNQEYEVDTATRISEKKSIALAIDLISSKLGQLKRALLAK